jgi:alpha/beta superfamily hydrolase
MAKASEPWLLDGPAGAMDVIVDLPDDGVGIAGIALVAHPHPLFGGANTNKVTYTLAHAFCELSFVALRPNFRGIGKSAGTHDNGVGETDDLLWLLEQARARFDPEHRLPTALAGFSFGAYVQTRVAKRLADTGAPAKHLALVAVASGAVEGTRHYQPEPIPEDSLLIHGDLDTTVPLANVLAFARPLNLPVVVIPGADHFFHGKLNLLRTIVKHTFRV